MGLAPSTSTKWCTECLVVIILHKNNSSPLQNRKRDSLFLSSRGELDFREGISINKLAFWGWHALLCWCCRLENAAKTCYPSTSNLQSLAEEEKPGKGYMKSTSGMLCGRMFTAKSVSHPCLWRCVFLWVLHNSFAKKSKNSLCQMTADPTRRQLSEKGMASIRDQTSVSNSIANGWFNDLWKHKVDGYCLPNGGWVRSYDKALHWELCHLWYGKTAQRKRCEACAIFWISFAKMILLDPLMQWLSMVHFPNEIHYPSIRVSLGQRATCPCGVLRGWWHDTCWVAENAEVPTKNVKRINTRLRIIWRISWLSELSETYPIYIYI